MDTTLSALHTLSHLNLTSPRKLGHFVYEETEAQKCSVTFAESHGHCRILCPVLERVGLSRQGGKKSTTPQTTPLQHGYLLCTPEGQYFSENSLKNYNDLSRGPGKGSQRPSTPHLVSCLYPGLSVPKGLALSLALRGKVFQQTLIPCNRKKSPFLHQP